MKKLRFGKAPLLAPQLGRSRVGSESRTPASTQEGSPSFKTSDTMRYGFGCSKTKTNLRVLFYTPLFTTLISYSQPGPDAAPGPPERVRGNKVKASTSVEGEAVSPVVCQKAHRHGTGKQWACPSRPHSEDTVTSSPQP